MPTQITPPYPLFADADGTPLDAGYIYIGEPNQNPEEVPIAVYWDSDLIMPAEQPIRTSGGYPIRAGTPSSFFTAQAFHSIIVKNKKSVVVYSAADVPQ